MREGYSIRNEVGVVNLLADSAGASARAVAYTYMSCKTSKFHSIYLSELPLAILSGFPPALISVVLLQGNLHQ